MLRALPAETRGQPVAYKDTAGSDGLRPSVLNPFQADPFLLREELFVLGRFVCTGFRSLCAKSMQLH